MRALATALIIGLVAAVLGLSAPAPASAATTWPDASAWPDQISFAQTPSGMAFSPDGSTLYASQMGEGVIAVSSSGQISNVIRSQDDFYAVGVEPDGNLLVSLAYAPYIYRVDMTDVKANPGFYLAEGNWKTRAAIVYTSPANEGGITALTVGPDGTIYYGTQEAQIRFLENGVSVPLLAQASAFYSFSGLNVLPNGGLAIVELGAGVVYGIPAAPLAARNVPSSAFRTLATRVWSRGIAVLDNRTFYDNSGTKKQFTGQLLSAPGAPTGLTATAGDQQASLQWAAPADDGGAAVSSYTVQQSQNGSWVDVATVQTTSAALTGLTNGTSHSYRVRAVNSEGAGTPSDPVTITPFALSPTFRVDGEVLSAGDPVRLGASVTASGAGLPVGATVSMKLRSGSAPLASGVAGQGGVYALTGTVPATTRMDADALVLTMTDDSGSQRSASLSIDITVGEPAWPNASAWPDQLVVPSMYGMAFSPDAATLYATQYNSGIAAVSPSGAWARFIQSRTPFMGVAAEIDGNLLVTVDGDPNIYRIDIADVRAHPDAYMRTDGWKASATVVYTTASASISGIAAAPDGTIYYSSSGDHQIHVLREGVSTTLLAQPFGTGFNALGVFLEGSLIAIGDDGNVYGIARADVVAGAVPQSAVEPVATEVGDNAIAFFRDGTFYTSSSGSKHRFAMRPGMPTGLEATAGDGQVSLVWAAPEDDGGAAVTSYLVQALRDGVWVDIATSETIDATITGLTNGTETTYRVLAVNFSGASEPSDTVAATPFLLAPTFTANDLVLHAGDSLTTGASVTVNGSGLPPGSTVTLELHSTPITLATGRVGANGSYTLTGSIPAYALPGSHNLVVTLTLGSGAQSSVSQPVTIAAAAAVASVSPSGGSSANALAVTGAGDAAPLVYGATLALLAGLALLITRRTRTDRNAGIH